MTVLESTCCTCNIGVSVIYSGETPTDIECQSCQTKRVERLEKMEREGILHLKNERLILEALKAILYEVDSGAHWPSLKKKIGKAINDLGDGPGEVG